MLARRSDFDDLPTNAFRIQRSGTLHHCWQLPGTALGALLFLLVTSFGPPPPSCFRVSSSATTSISIQKPDKLAPPDEKLRAQTLNRVKEAYAKEYAKSDLESKRSLATDLAQLAEGQLARDLREPRTGCGGFCSPRRVASTIHRVL
jgi:hypothetical protein